MSAPDIEPVASRNPWPWRLKIVAVIATAAFGIALISFWALGSTPSKPHAPAASSAGIAHDQSGRIVQLDSTITPQQAAEQHAVDAVVGQRVQIPSVGFDVPLGAITVSQGAVTPPGVLSVYLIRNLGVSIAEATHGTVFLVIHSVHGNADVPGNRLIDIGGARSTLTDGTLISVAGRKYRVTHSAVISRDALPGAAQVWTNKPGQLVLITCLERPDERTAISNVVVWAELAR